MWKVKLENMWKVFCTPFNAIYLICSIGDWLDWLRESLGFIYQQVLILLFAEAAV